MKGETAHSLFFNESGREPEGTIDPSEYDSFRADLKARLEATTDPQGRVLGTLVFEPEQIYRSVRNIPPDLIVQFGGLSSRARSTAWETRCFIGDQARSARGTVALRRRVPLFSRCPVFPERASSKGLPCWTSRRHFMELGGREPFPGLQGRSLLSRPRADSSPGSADLDADEILVRERLSGLGYLG